MSTPLQFITEGRPNNIASGFLQSFIGAHQQLEQQRDQEEKDKANKTLQLLLQMEPNVSPEYRDHIHKTIVDMINLPTGKKGSAQLHSMLQGLSQLSGGEGPDVQTQDNQVSGYQGVTGDNLSVPSGPTSNPVSLANSQQPLMGSAPLSGSMSVAGGASLPLSQLGGMLGQTPLVAPSTGGDFSGGQDTFDNGPSQPFSERSPLVTAKSSLAIPQKPLLNTVDKAGFNVKGRIPLMEDPLQKQVKLQTALGDIKDQQDEDRQARREATAQRLLKAKQDYTDKRDKAHNEAAINLAGIKNDQKTNGQINIAKANLKPLNPQQMGESDDAYNQRLTVLAAGAVKQHNDNLENVHKTHAALFTQQAEASKEAMQRADEGLALRKQEVAGLIAKRGNDTQQQIVKNNLKYLDDRKASLNLELKNLHEDELKLKTDDDGYVPAKNAIEERMNRVMEHINTLNNDIQSVAQGGTAKGSQPKSGGGQPSQPKESPEASAAQKKFGADSEGNITTKDGKKFHVTGIGPNGGPMGKPVQ